ncbi:MAG: thioredoxin domain-containing protein [Candidatus Phlomobacter fragariae]
MEKIMKRHLTIGLLLGTFLLPMVSLAETSLSSRNIKRMVEAYEMYIGKLTPVLNEKARMGVIVLYNYHCKSCAKMAPMILNLAKTHTDIRFVFKNLPDKSEQSILGAQTELMVWHRGGETAFLKYFIELFKNANVQQAIEKSKVSLTDIQTELANTAIDNDVMSLVTAHYANQLNIKKLPTFIIVNFANPAEENTTILTGMVDKKTLLVAVEKAGRGE